MIRLEIDHVSEFAYSRQVFLEPHTLRLCPRQTWRQRLLRFDLEIEPEPAGRADSVGLDDNLETVLWFSGLTDRLWLRSRSLVELPPADPFAFLSDPGFLAFPVTYPPRLAASLGPYLRRPQPEAAVDDYLGTVDEAAGGQVLPFLGELASRLGHDVEKTIREEGDPLSPAATLASGRGACRDLAELFVDACRARRLASRFVSGYHESEARGSERFLHAWAEVYIPGGGWRGYDPSLGLAVADRHVAVACGPSHAGARPCEGLFRGTGVTSRLTATIHMQVLGNAAASGEGEPEWPAGGN